MNWGGFWLKTIFYILIYIGMMIQDAPSWALLLLVGMYVLTGRKED